MPECLFCEYPYGTVEHLFQAPTNRNILLPPDSYLKKKVLPYMKNLTADEYVNVSITTWQWTEG